MRGRYFFTKQDVLNAFPELKEHSIAMALTRLVSSKRIVSPWQNFYVVVSMEYRLRGIVSEHFYIDQLMGVLERNYYVGLLTAAALHGASHQQSMTYFVMAEGTPLRNIRKKGSKVDFIQKNNINNMYVDKVKSQTGTINVSSPLMTALDLVQHERKVGGLSRVAEVLYELMEVVVLDVECINLLKSYPRQVLQRFGYILSLLEKDSEASKLYALCKNNGIKFRKTALKPSKSYDKECGYDEQWKIIINQEIDIDDI